MNALTFNNITLTPVKQDTQIWLSSSDLAKALGYANEKSVNNLYNARSDEFTNSMTTVIESMTVRKTGNVIMPKRIFSLRGCHLIAMFARTSVAKEFRKWVLDILDKEVGTPVVIKTAANDRTYLRQAVSLLVSKKGLDYATAYQMVHQYMGVNHIDEIEHARLPVAVEYVHHLALGHHQGWAKLVNYSSDGKHQAKKNQENIDTLLDHLSQIVNCIEEIQIRNDRQARLFKTLV